MIPERLYSIFPNYNSVLTVDSWLSQAEFPSIKKLVTLSPVPQFKPWLLGKLSNTFATEDGQQNLLSEKESSLLLKLLPESSNGKEGLLTLINDPE